MLEYEEEIELYVKELEDFIGRFELPDKWFRIPDHIAIKCADNLDYDYRLQELMPDGHRSYEARLDNRRLASIQLTNKIEVGILGTVGWLELMEPRPEKVGKDIVGVEHMEFYFPDFEEVKKTLAKYKIPYAEESNPGHSWINILINDDGQELKINNGLLADIVAKELDDGRVRELLS